MIMIFWSSLLVKRPYTIFLVTFIMFRHVKVGKHIEYMRQNVLKKRAHCKSSSWVMHLLFLLFTLRWNFISTFLTEMSLSRQKCVNSNKHLTIDKVDFIPGWILFKHTLNNKKNTFCTFTQALGACFRF